MKQVAVRLVDNTSTDEKPAGRSYERSR